MSGNEHCKRGSVPRSAYETAAGLLARREQSRRELRQRLDRRGYDGAESEAALDRFAADRYQDDARFGEMLVRTRIAQGYGPARLRAELGSHGLTDAVIGELIGEIDVDWFELARTQLSRRYHGEPASDRKELARRAQYLLRRGFDAGTARRAAEACMDEADDSGDNAR